VIDVEMTEAALTFGPEPVRLVMAQNITTGGRRSRREPICSASSSGRAGTPKRRAE
jgi:hypothetical protein